MSKTLSMGVLHGRGVIALIIGCLLLYGAFPVSLLLTLILHEFGIYTVQIDGFGYKLKSGLIQTDNILYNQLNSILIPAFAALTSFILTADRQRSIPLLIVIFGSVVFILLASFLGSVVASIGTLANVFTEAGDAEVVQSVKRFFTEVQDRMFIYILMLLGIEGGKAVANRITASDVNNDELRDVTQTLPKEKYPGG
jgi:hypothetical protein